MGSTCKIYLELAPSSHPSLLLQSSRAPHLLPASLQPTPTSLPAHTLAPLCSSDQAILGSEPAREPHHTQIKAESFPSCRTHAWSGPFFSLTSLNLTSPHHRSTLDTRPYLCSSSAPGKLSPWSLQVEGAGNSAWWSASRSLVAQTVKNPPVMQKTWVWSLGREDPLEEGLATHSRILENCLVLENSMDRGACGGYSP